MTRRHKKRKNSNYKKFFNRPRQNQQNDTENETKAVSIFSPQAKKKSVKNLQRKPCLSIVERAAKILKGPHCTDLISILDGLFALYTKESTKRSLQLELVKMLLLKLIDGDTDFNALKTELNVMFWPKDLKKIMVDASKLEETTEWILFLGLPLPISTDEGYLRIGQRVKVQIKKSHNDEDIASIIQEAKLLSQLHHKNIIKLLGFDKSGPRMALEHMSLGNLCEALETYRFSGPKLLNILKEVTAGMSHLAEKKYVLRNLSSENILMDSSGSCKISNLEYCQYVGDTGGTYIDEGSYMDTDVAAPEVRNGLKFSTKSDVWDMGLLGWEVFLVEPDETMFSFLSAGVRKFAFLRLFTSRNVLPQPSKCPDLLWLFIQHRVLRQDPAERPTFAEITNELKRFDN